MTSGAELLAARGWAGAVGAEAAQPSFLLATNRSVRRSSDEESRVPWRHELGARPWRQWLWRLAAGDARRSAPLEGQRRAERLGLLRRRGEDRPRCRERLQ